MPAKTSSARIEQYFATARERYAIMRRRDEGQPPPWTEDKIFQAWRFTNVHREDDKTTRWFRENIREPLRNDPKVLIATVGFRWFNTIRAGELLKDLYLEGWNAKEALRRLNADPTGLFTGAYVIRSEAGYPKHEATVRAVDWFKRWKVMRTRDTFTLQSAHEALMEAPFLGGFMAYELVSDLRHTYLLQDASDIMSWCHLGPGATRGLGILADGNPHYFQQHSAHDQEIMLRLALDLLEESWNRRSWPPQYKPWEMREVEHWLCEYSKYVKLQQGGRGKRRFAA